MRFATLCALLLIPATAWAQNATASEAYLQQVLGALTAANLTSLVSVASAIANTTAGATLLGGLASGNKTVFAPSNSAFAAVPANVSSDTDLLTEILSYHILNRTYSAGGVATAPNHTIARTLLKGGNYSLPGNFSAPLVLSKSANATNSTAFQIVQATDNVNATGPATAANLEVYIIDEVLSLPPSLTDAATALLPSLAGLIQSANLLTPLESAQGITVFAPVDSAIAGVESALGTLNSTQISTILANHVINGTVVYSTGLASGNYTSAAGEPFKFMTNSTGTFVMSANSTAQIVQSDIIIENGVVHLINGVLVNTMADPSAAASAYSSGIAAAATSTEGTAAVTATSAAGTSTASGGSSSSKSSKSASGRLEPLGLTSSMLGGVVAVVGAVVGGSYVWF